MAKVDVRYNRTKAEWLARSFGVGIAGAALVLVVGYVLSSIGTGLGRVGFGVGFSLGLRPCIVVGAVVFALITIPSLWLMRPRLISGGDGAGALRPAGRARVWTGTAADDQRSDDGASHGAPVSV